MVIILEKIRFLFHLRKRNFSKQPSLLQWRFSGPGGTPIWNRRGCSSKILNLTPKGDHLGVAHALCDHQRRPIWAWLNQLLTPKRDRLKTHKYDVQ